MRVVFFILYFFCLVIAKNGIAQPYRFHHYRVEQGLPSDVIKAVSQDSLGFLWIATDDGLVKFDGLRFTTYKDAVPGQYLKGFLHTKDGKFLAFGDLNVVEINNQIDTVIFKNFLRGDRFISDSTIFFPKLMYEDQAANIWISEPKTIAKYSNKKLTRYDLGEANRSSVFVRSFSFFEAEGYLYAVAYNGNLFRYSSRDDGFIDVGINFSEDVSHALVVGDKLLLAGREGLLMCEFKNGSFGDPKNILPIGQVSHVLTSPDSSIFVSTYNEDLYRIKLYPHFQWENLYHNFNGINSCFISKENDLWAATDKGLVLVQKNLFVLTDDNSQTHFIEGTAYDVKNKKLYYCIKEVLVELENKGPGEWVRKKIEESRNHYFQALQFDGDKLWASTRWEILVFKNSKIIHRLDFSADGNFVQDLFLDSKKNIWVSQAGTPNVKVIDQSFSTKRIPVEGLTQKDINLIREGKNGMYLATSGTSRYLYFKADDDTVFRDVSLPLPFVSGTDFNITDMAIDKNETIWLATKEGLLKSDGTSIERINYDAELDRYPITSVEILDDENILFSNSFGLFRYNVAKGEYWLYDENTGLPSNTITDQGIFVSEDKHVWIGTSYGIANATTSLLEDDRTQTPYCIEARVNGKSSRFIKGVLAPYGSFITLKFSPISFPESRISIQWKFSTDSTWSALQNNQLELSNVSHGKHKILFRAKKNTGFGWSKENSVDLIIQPPYWKRAEFIFVVLFAIIVIAWGSYAISAVIMSKRRQYLQEQINERTRELQIANEELIQRNVELDRFVYSASHDLSAPLKSILGLIKVAKMDDPDETHLEYLDMMERSVHKLELFIQEVVTYSRNARMPVRYEPFDFKHFVEGLLQDHEYSENYDRISFVIEDNLGGKIISDMTRMKIILNNLLSNAIKFHWSGDGRKPVVHISLKQLNEQYVLKVSDNGRGISSEHIKRIFEMFYRATEETQGSGLGLYILKESVLKLGGMVEAESRLEQGTTFTIKLPVPGV